MGNPNKGLSSYAIIKAMRKYAIAIMLLLTLVVPNTAAAAISFGGPINTIIGCLNMVTYTVLGPPRGGEYLWSPSITDTYSFGPPTRRGQWLLGNAGPSYFCLVTVLPLDVRPGWLIMMMGSSR